jgi:DNA-directed RNA polymerase subunit RPC12/RpoP
MYGKKVNDDYVCITCGAEIEHNYGTDEYPQCIICGNEPAQSN